jgi:hypothetical protein
MISLQYLQNIETQDSWLLLYIYMQFWARSFAEAKMKEKSRAIG